MEIHTVILEEDVAVDARTMGPDLARILGNTVLEARLMIRKARGIFLENLPEDQAEDVADLLRINGVGARAVPAGKTPILPSPRRISHVERGQDGLRMVTAGTDDTDTLPWDRVDIISVGVVARPGSEDHFSHVPFEYVPSLQQLDAEDRKTLRERVIQRMDEAPAREKGREDRSTYRLLEDGWSEKVRVYADILTPGGEDWLRVSMSDFGYAQDADSVRMGGALGFGLLMKELGARRPEAFTDLTRRIESGENVEGLVFTRIEEFHRYSMWWCLRKEDPDPPNEPAP